MTVRLKPKIAVKPGVSKGGKPLLVRLPHKLGGHLMPESGMLVPDDIYWKRRLKGKDVVRIKKSALLDTPVKTSKK